MDWSPVDPSSLEGNDLTRWYLRSPDEIEQQRQTGQAQRHNEFFGRTAPTSPPATSPALAYQDPSVTTGDGPTWEVNGTNSWRRQDRQAYKPSAEVQPGLFGLAVAQGVAAPGIANCPTCHGRGLPVPPVLPFPFPFLPGGPFFRDTPSTPSGGGSPKRRFPQCEVQYDEDTEICGGLSTPVARGKCRESASERQAYCLNHDGEVGWPPLLRR